MNLRPFALVALVLLGPPDAGADIAPVFHAETFSHLREITPPPGAGLYRLSADPDLFRHSGAGHRRLHLVNGKGDRFTEIPWVIRAAPVPPPPRDERVIPHHIESFGKRLDGSIEIVVRLEAGSAAPARLEFETPLHDFEKGVTLSVPDAGADDSWTELVKDGFIFDHSSFLDFRHTGMSLPETTARRFRIHVDDATDEQRSLVRQLSRTLGDHSGLTVSESGTVTTRPFRIDAIRFLSAPTKSQKREDSRSSLDLTLLEPPVTEQGETRLVLDGAEVPLNRIHLTTGDRNFRRAVTLQVPDPAVPGAWRTIHRTHVHRYELGIFHDESLTLSFREVRAERFRLLVENGDNTPLTIESVRGSGYTYDLIFIAENGDLPRLFFEDPSATLTNRSLDTAAIEAALGRGLKAETLEFGPLTPNPLFRSREAPRMVEEKFLESKTALSLIIALAVAVLIGVLYRALRQIEGVEGNP